MANVNGEKALRDLMRCAMEVSPNGIVQQAFSNSVNEMRADGMDHVAIVSELAISIHEGLAFGNWPK